MSHAVAEELRQDLASEDLLECVHGLTDLDRAGFQALTDADDPLTIDEVAARVDRERSTAYRSVHRLVDAGLLEKDQVNYEQGGYYHVYRPVDPDDAADEMASLLDQWHDQMTDLVAQFREEYRERVTVETGAE